MVSFLVMYAEIRFTCLQIYPLSLQYSTPYWVSGTFTIASNGPFPTDDSSDC